MKTALVLGAGGFIGSHLVKRLKSDGYFVRGADLKEPEFSFTTADEFIIADLRDRSRVEAVCRLTTDLRYSFLRQAFSELTQFDEIYQLAADMGGAGYIFTGEHDADVMHNSCQINLNVLDVLKEGRFRGKVFYSSSACMYPRELQDDHDAPYTVAGLSEDDAYPANPDSEYGWEKLFSERMYLAYARNYGLNVRIARFHNIYGPEGTYKGGREKAPAAICRKVAEASTEIEIWGDGRQTRSFLFIEDCVDAVRGLVQSDYGYPVNIGSEEMVTINGLADMVIGLSGKRITIKHIDGPVGVRGRNSDNTLVRNVLGWEPKFSLREGMEILYTWIAYDRT